MLYRPILFSSFLFLTACGYAIDKSIQDITIKTPGAHSAVCNMYVDNFRYKVRPPQTVTISKSKEDLVIDCLAPGNRRQKVVIAADLGRHAPLNTLTGVVPGLAWDYSSGALFQYPSIVEVDFTHTPVRPEDLPAQNNPDIKQPEAYNLEEFLPGTPRLNSDQYAPASEIRRRRSPNEYTDSGLEGYITEGEGTEAGKGELQTIEILPGLNPTAPDEAAPAEGPIPLYPGE